MANEKLTALKVSRARTPGLLNDGKGLYLRVAAGGTKSWVYRFMMSGRAREMGLGALGDVTLAEARDLAREARRLCKQGIDPIEARHAKRAAQAAGDAKAMTFRECAERYVGAHQASWKNLKHAKQWPASLETYVYPVFGSRSVAAIDVALVTKVLDPIWAAKPRTASRVRARIEAVLDWATARKFRQGGNPAQWKGHLEFLLPKTSRLARVERHAALPYPEIGDFMAALRRQSGVAAWALEFVVLTGVRTGEAREATWEEFGDLAEKTWTIPAERMKGDREHRVPLSDRAIEILDEMRAFRRGALVFPGAKVGRPLSHGAMLRVLAAMGRGDLTVHGFRSTFRDWAAECTNFPREVCDAALAHAVESKVEAAYRRSDLFQKRWQLMAAWARYCTAPGSQGEVVQIAAAR
jgi:integrase